MARLERTGRLHRAVPRLCAFLLASTIALAATPVRSTYQPFHVLSYTHGMRLLASSELYANYGDYLRHVHGEAEAPARRPKNIHANAMRTLTLLILAERPDLLDVLVKNREDAALLRQRLEEEDALRRLHTGVILSQSDRVDMTDEERERIATVLFDAQKSLDVRSKIVPKIAGQWDGSFRFAEATWGDTLAAIVRRCYRLDSPWRHQRAMNVVRRLNPEYHNSDRLEVGGRVALPVVLVLDDRGAVTVRADC